MAVFLDSVTPGIALGTADANKLKTEIHTYVTGIPNFRAGNTVTWKDYKDPAGTKREVRFTVVSIGNDIHVNLTKY